MGIEDRDWYREKRIDWERGGLKEHTEKKHLAKYAAWTVIGIIVIAAIWYWMGRLR